MNRVSNLMRSFMPPAPFYRQVEMNAAHRTSCLTLIPNLERNLQLRSPLRTPHLLPSQNLMCSFILVLRALQSPFDLARQAATQRMLRACLGNVLTTVTDKKLCIDDIKIKITIANVRSEDRKREKFAFRSQYMSGWVVLNVLLKAMSRPSYIL